MRGKNVLHYLQLFTYPKNSFEKACSWSFRLVRCLHVVAPFKQAFSINHGNDVFFGCEWAQEFLKVLDSLLGGITEFRMETV
jgi:hypothetical protein